MKGLKKEDKCYIHVYLIKREGRPKDRRKERGKVHTYQHYLMMTTVHMTRMTQVEKGTTNN